MIRVFSDVAMNQVVTWAKNIELETRHALSLTLFLFDSCFSGTYAAGDTNNDGYVTGMDLGLYLWNEVPKHTDQTPQFGRIKDFKLSRGDFVLRSIRCSYYSLY
jgi:hypothetical protein